MDRAEKLVANLKRLGRWVTSRELSDLTGIPTTKISRYLTGRADVEQGTHQYVKAKWRYVK